MQEIQKTKLTEKYSEEDLEECDEVLENEEELENSCDTEVAAAVDKSITVTAGDLIPVKRANGREDLMSRARMLTIKVPAIVSLQFWMTKHKRREGVRRQNKTVLHDFQVAQATSGRCGGAGWPENLLWRQRRKRRHRWEEDWASMYGEGLGFQTVFYENRDLRVVGVRNCDGKVGDSGGDRRRRREMRCWKWRYGDEQFRGYGVETRKSVEGMSSKTTVMAVTFNKEGKGKEGNRVHCGRLKKVTHSLMLFTDTCKASHLLLIFSMTTYSTLTYQIKLPFLFKIDNQFNFYPP
uniref:Uncharacterized protein n=1 Tax=Amaranthus palmeri TaxID=107608 RepID=A0A6C0T730_AMAPA|nr:hypothetical protein AP_R.00g000070-v1.0.a3 [Amaranthus palmeri]